MQVDKYRAADLVTTPGGAPRAMLGGGTFPIGVEVDGCRLFTLSILFLFLFMLAPLPSTVFPDWLISSMIPSPSANSSRDSGCTRVAADLP